MCGGGQRIADRGRIAQAHADGGRVAGRVGIAGRAAADVDVAAIGEHRSVGDVDAHLGTAGERSKRQAGDVEVAGRGLQYGEVVTVEVAEEYTRAAETPSRENSDAPHHPKQPPC